MADIILNNSIVSLTANNNYIVNSVVNYSNATVNSVDNVTITVEKGGKITNATISTTGTTYIAVKTTDIAFEAVSFTGDFEQDGDIVIKKTIWLENYTLPNWFKVRSINYANKGDEGGATLVYLPKEKLIHRNHVYFWNPIITKPNVVIIEENNEYKAESIGVVRNDVTKIDSNARVMERHLGGNYRIKFAATDYYIADINVDTFIDYQGYNLSYVVANIIGSNNEINEGQNESNISTEGRNFIFSVNSMSFVLVAQYIDIRTIASGLSQFSPAEQTKPRTGYAITRFDKHPSDPTAVPSTEAELCLRTNHVSFYGFQGAFYSGQYSTDCHIRNTIFNGCRYGFYSRAASNLTSIEDTQIHNCAFGIVGGGAAFSMRNIELTPENFYRDPEALATPFFYGYMSLDANHPAKLENIYLEDYLGDAESRAKFVLYSISVDAGAVLDNCILQEITNETSAYHLEITKPVGYAPDQISSTSAVVNIINGEFPTKVRTTEPWLLRGVTHNGSYGFTKKDYSNNGVPATMEFFSGLGVSHFWKAKPTVFKPTNDPYYYLNFAQTDFKYYNGMVSANTVPVNLESQLHNVAQASFVAPALSTKQKIGFRINGYTLVNKPFTLRIGLITHIITPYRLNGDDETFVFDYTYFAQKRTDEFFDLTSSVTPSFHFIIGYDNADSDLIHNSKGEIIEVEMFDFSCYV